MHWLAIANSQTGTIINLLYNTTNDDLFLWIFNALF